ncbi:ethanolamine ammonia-lyase subunit EutC [Methylobacterium aerolatum]|uniref:Ethanolamine ammonia-lyase small subunit n=1 Tax=Methylobacterium aerolatum TaxID=418708 RepID=A0ABU0I278_9HYPH|nr:ethanolamine ammonia-lyase subunit EutC [Methylobacterium aerolatum]MDQ0448697.1 ethanolamine ammonia-lyase small subunit [Methylobacterium aerolatum]GJD34979.1 Ethanolamine ammonia-lyase light chain [Methylobacterium aerolatum]
MKPDPDTLPDGPLRTDLTQDDRWAALRRATPARIGLGRTGDALPLRPMLDFQLAHAQARDAVHAVLDVEALAAALPPHPVLRVHSAAPDRPTYLRRPDLGRRLDDASIATLEEAAAARAQDGGQGFDLVFVIADGLSAKAVASHAVPVIHACLALLDGYRIAPIVLAEQGRVALGDPVGERLGARLSVVLIGERPGLSVADSLGLYLTYGPRPGRRDSERNCISNVHGRGGLTPDLAAAKVAWFVREALRRGLTGVALKDGIEEALLEGEAGRLPGGSP